MIVPDANLLLYATDSTSPFHDAARQWWTSCLNGVVPVGLCDPVVFAFVRISTHPRAFERALVVVPGHPHRPGHGPTARSRARCTPARSTSPTY